MKVVDEIRQTHIRFRNIDNFESYISSIDESYDAEDAIFNGYIYKKNTPQLNKVNRIQYGSGCDFKQEIIEYRGKNCFVSTKGCFFVECINFPTGQDYKQQYLDFFRSEQRRSNIMTKARIQPFCRANKFNLGYYDGERVFPRSVTERNNALFLCNNHFCLIWKRENISFKQAIKELKDNFKIVDNYITEENVNSHFQYEFIPKKIESHLTNFILYVLETHNKDRARPYVFCFYRLSKLAGKYYRNLTPYELDKSRKDTIAFNGDNCDGKALDFCLKLKGEEYKDKKGRVLAYGLQLHAHNGSGFDTWIVLNNLPCDKRIVNKIKNGKIIIELKVFNGYVEKKQIPQYLHFGCGMTRLIYSLKKLCKTFKLQKEFLKTELDHDEVDSDNNKDKIDEWLHYVKNDVRCTAFSYGDIVKLWKK